MANAFSILHNYDTPVYSPDFNFINAALTFKQNNLNANRAKLQNLYDQFASLQVVKDIDQKYIEERLTQVRDTTNKYASMDLSDPNFAASLMSNMTQVLDDRVKAAILSKKRMGAEDAVWKDMSKNKRELYSEANHQYAINVLSDRQRYLNSTEVGDTYRGGADFFEYRDTTKKFMDNLPNLEKFLGAKYFQTGPQEGYFRTIDTYEYIDQNKLRQATEMLFDEKDKLQMNSNAWAKYGNLDDDQLRGEFSSYMTPRLEDARAKLSNLETLYSKSSDTEEKTQLQADIEASKKAIKTLEDATYDNALKAGGARSVYTSLYKDQYLNGLVAPYAAPRLVDRKVDEVHKANVEFGLKMQEMELKKLESAAKILKSSGKAAGGQAPILGDPTKVESERAREASIDYALEEYNAAMESFETVKGKDESGNVVTLGNLTLNEKLQVGKVLQGTDLSSKRTVEFTVRGKKITVNVAQNAEKILEFKNYVLQDSPAVKQAAAESLQQMKKVEQRLITVSDYNNNQAIAQLPNLNKKFVKQNGKFVLEETEDDKYIKNLLRAAKTRDLTEAEQLTITMYSNYMYMVDPKVDKNIRQQAFNANHKMLFDKVGDMQTIRSLPATLGEVEANFTPTGITTQAKKAQAEIQALQQKLRTAKTPTEKENIQNQIDSKKRYQQRVTLAKPIWQGIDPDAMFAVGRDPYLSSIGFENVGSDKSLSALVDATNDTLKKTLEDKYTQSGLVPTVRSVIFNKESEDYETLNALVGGNATGTITINTKVTEDYKLADEQEIVYQEKGGKTTPPKTIKLSTLEENGIKLNPGLRTPYNARFKQAPTIDLGTMNVDPEKASRAVSLGLSTFSPQYLSDRINQAAQYGQEFEAFVRNEMKMFKTGAYSVKAVPNTDTGKYDFILVNREGKELKRTEGTSTELSMKEVSDAVVGDNGLIIKNNLFANYIDEVIKRIEEKSIYQASDEVIRDLLQY
jgi:hypothetical protein